MNDRISRLIQDLFQEIEREYGWLTRNDKDTIHNKIQELEELIKQKFSEKRQS